MIPLKLSLKNFLCYGESVPTLDLEGIHVACLCGRNGHGKSALLDAITWALWGKARSKAQDELIRYGQEEMLVDLEFLARGTRYRAIRRHARGGSRRRQGATDLQFQVFTGAGFHPITENSIRETQAKIDQIIGMDYETFINSAFLLQGRADEFTNKTSMERMDVLAKVMGLDLYDRLQERFKERLDGKKSAVSIVEGDLDRMRQEVSRKDGYHSELETVNKELSRVRERLDASRQARDALKVAVDNLRRKRGELEEIKACVPAIETDISHRQKEIDSRKAAIATYQALVGDEDAIKAGLAQYQQVRQRYEEINRSRDRFDHLMGCKSDLERAIDSAKARLDEQVKQMERRIEGELRPRANAAPAISEKLDGARARLDELAKDERDIEDKRQRLNELAVQVGQFQAKAEQLETEGRELRSKLDLVQNSHQGAHCPLCGTELGAEGCQRLLDNYKAQREEKLHLYLANQNALKGAEGEKSGLEDELPKREAASRRSQQRLQRDVVTLEHQLRESQEAAETIEQVSPEMAQEKRRLEQRLYATKEQGELTELQAQIVVLGYDQEAHRRLYNEMQELQPFGERQRRLQEAIARLPQEQELLALAEVMCQRRQKDLAESKAKQLRMADEVLELPQWEGRLQAAESAGKELDARHDELFRSQVELESDLKELEELERKIDEKERKLKALREEQGICQELTDAFGKRGIQAMLIETVLPRLEEEANALLDRMTDGRMHLKLETQRVRKSGKGEPIETLEIKVSDEMGPRSYELFSGGEAFRINLALRIALSKVLAHRKGAPLPTLFIDEGFGTQDAAGRERILDVISAIERDFDKIIVITHLDELKEAFQARIEVQKEEAGSTFWISY